MDEVKVIASVQNSKAFGPEIEIIRTGHEVEVFEKLHFSMMRDSHIQKKLIEFKDIEGINTVFLWGLLAEACIT